MSDILKTLYNACDPSKPASPQQYLDLTAARGSDALTQDCGRRLRLANNTLRFLFTGHIGSGKSSELLALSRALHNPGTGAKRYLPVVVDASDYLDDYDADIPDLLLVIVTELAETLREQAGIELKEHELVRRFQGLTSFLGREVDTDGVEIPLPKIKIQLLKRDPTARDTVRKAVESRQSAVLEEVNDLLALARLRLKQKVVEPAYADVVLIIDNLEKIRRFGGKAEGHESQRELFLERAPQLTGINAHVVYTVPLPLAHHYGRQLEQRFGGPLLVLPMVKVVERETLGSCRSGLACLQELLRRRLSGIALEEVFEPPALEFLLKYSGGHVRTLMTFIQASCTYTDVTPIPLRAAQRAVQQGVRTYSTAIREAHWEKLARLELSPDRKIDNGDVDYLAMLENLSILEYRNSDSDEDVFEDAEPWFVVNPVVRELQRFKAAVTRLRNASPSAPESTQ
ncbi:MAG TPA: hypothetical protein VK689_17010 [Armatimonadota bacterium]|nr:hypothetical protein [Armatimonadota bacterium]